MRNAFSLLLCCSSLAWAGAHDYYECKEASGAVVFSMEPCGKGHQQRRIKDDAAPVTVQLEKGVGGLVRLENARGGNFYTRVSINGVSVRAMVDTGASSVAVSPTAAVRMGLDRRPFVSGWSQTANGVTQVRHVVLNRVELQGNVIEGVGGVILSKDMGRDFDVLLGMSFLKSFEVNTAGGVMTLQPRY